jgi:protein-export chaperone SecB
MAENEQTPEKQLAIQKIYIKDFSFESPNTPPHIFGQADWSPKTDLNLRSSHTAGSEDNHEVVLTITVEAKEDDKTVFLIELHQAGLFHVAGYSDDEFKSPASFPRAVFRNSCCSRLTSTHFMPREWLRPKPGQNRMQPRATAKEAHTNKRYAGIEITHCGTWRRFLGNGVGAPVCAKRQGGQDVGQRPVTA